MSKTELTATVRNLKELMMMKAELEAEIEAAQDVVKAEMTAQGVEEMILDVFKVRWTNVVSNRFDTTVFRQANADLYSRYCKETASRRFSIA